MIQSIPTLYPLSKRKIVMVHRLTLVMELLKKDNMARHFLVMAGFGFVIGIFNYLYQLAMGRMLQPSEYGVLMSLNSLFMVVTVLAITIRTAMAKFISKYHAENNLEAIGYLWRVYQKRLLIFGAIAFVFVAALSPQISGFLRIGNPWYPVVLFSSLTLAFVFPLNQGALNGLHRFFSLGWTDALWPLLRFVLAILLIKLGMGLYGGLAPSMIAYIVVVPITYYILKDLPRNGRGSVEPSGLRSYVSLSFIAILAYTMLTWVDMILVKHFLNDDQAGNYAAIAALGRVSLFAPMGIALALFPKTSGLHELGKSHRPVLLIAVLFTTLLTSLVVIIYWLFPNFFVNLLGSGKYTLAAPYLYKYGMAMMFFAISYIFMNYFLSLNLIKIAYIFAAVGFLQILLILYFHGDIAQVANDVLVSSVVCLLANLIFYLWWQRPRCLIASDSTRNN
jgi:O-antigen/teichoic acid export membrane protein